MTSDLATIKEYGPPYWKERAWNLEAFEDWERELLAAVKVGSINSLEDELAALERSDEQWSEPHGKSTAHAFDFHVDIIQAGVHDTGNGLLNINGDNGQRLRKWRQLRAARFTPFNPDITDQMIAKLEAWEEHTLEDMRFNHLRVTDELVEPFKKWGVLR